MLRTDVYVKIELELDEKESAARIAAELCRMLRRAHAVREAEVSSIVDRES
jgi:hypothetical protein